MRAMLRHAYEHGYAVGSFEVADLGLLNGVVAAAERCRAPVILSVTEPRFSRDDLELLLPAVEAAARRASVPIAIQQDHCSGPTSAATAIRLGCNGILLERSPTDLAHLQAVVAMAHGCGIPVAGGPGGADATQQSNGDRDAVADAVIRYARDTGVDFLALSAGLLSRRPEHTRERLRHIDRSLQMPLILRRGAETNDQQIQEVVRCGVAAVNVGTRIEDAATDTIRAAAADSPSLAHLRHHIADTAAEEAERCITLWGGAGRAPELLSRAPSWEPIEHVITYSAEGLDEAGAAAMMEEGRRVLAQIPGVRAVHTGEAMNPETARYRYCWLVRFTHPAVIDSYRDHPLHVAFADDHFRPVASDRMSIDYRLIGSAAASPLPPPATEGGAADDA